MPPRKSVQSFQILLLFLVIQLSSRSMKIQYLLRYKKTACLPCQLNWACGSLLSLLFAVSNQVQVCRKEGPLNGVPLRVSKLSVRCLLSNYLCVNIRQLIFMRFIRKLLSMRTLSSSCSGGAALLTRHLSTLISAPWCWKRLWLSCLNWTWSWQVQ